MVRPNDPAPFAEDWSSYRKLVVDTLRRLDERTLEIYDKMADLTARVITLEQSGDSEDIKKLEERIAKVHDDYHDFKNLVNNNASTTKGVMWAVGIAWTLVTTLASIVISIVVK